MKNGKWRALRVGKHWCILTRRCSAPARWKGGVSWLKCKFPRIPYIRKKNKKKRPFVTNGRLSSLQSVFSKSRESSHAVSSTEIKSAPYRRIVAFRLLKLWEEILPPGDHGVQAGNIDANPLLQDFIPFSRHTVVLDHIFYSLAEPRIFGLFQIVNLAHYFVAVRQTTLRLNLQIPNQRRNPLSTTGCPNIKL